MVKMDELNRSGSKRLPRPIIFISVVFVSFILVAWHFNTEVEKELPQIPGIAVLQPRVDVGGLQRVTIDGIKAMVEIPHFSKGVVFIAHGCSHSATDFWKKSMTCRECLGLPEEVNITERLLERKYAVVAVSSSDRKKSRCWDVGNPEKPDSKDMRQVIRVLEEVAASDELTGKPMYALGVSSGGTFVMALALVYKLTGIAVQVAALPDRMFAIKKVKPYPPTMFIHMPLDPSTAQFVKEDIAKLTAEKVPTKEIRVTPQPITSTFLADKLVFPLSQIDHVGSNNTQAQALYQALKQASPPLLDKNDMLLANPRWSPWREAVQGIKGTVLKDMSLRADESPLAEVLNVAYASHEIVSDTTDSMLDWFEQLAAEEKKAAGRRVLQH